ncbi:hypothetical protein LIER_10483 [Lithospermum erythrorhizon]|uniref:Reverse transcriptase zinc-binding domain-containing protein n=1 Tax=Lithospermum erythrorhizon TaxID=34254 RepID=A0AAV3PLH7_LITER
MQPSTSIWINSTLKDVWKLKLSDKVKYFLWRGLTNFLPTSDNLVRRQIQIDTACKFCGHCKELVVHLFNTCKMARGVCKELTVQEEIEGAITFQDVFEQRKCRLPKNKFLIWVTYMWDLWYQRNLKTNGEPFRAAKEITSFAEGFLINHIYAPEQWKEISSRILV